MNQAPPPVSARIRSSVSWVSGPGSCCQWLRGTSLSAPATSAVLYTIGGLGMVPRRSGGGVRRHGGVGDAAAKEKRPARFDERSQVLVPFHDDVRRDVDLRLRDQP